MAEEVRSSANAFTKIHLPRETDGGTIYGDQAVLSRHGKEHPLIKKAEPPSEAFFVWDLYWKRFRSSGLSFTELKAYQDVYGIKLALWQIDLLYIIHAEVEKVMNEENQKKMQKMRNKPVKR